jgi:hypothetical protein
MCMGYHWDAKKLSGINIFDGEKCRRALAVIRQIDLLESMAHAALAEVAELAGKPIFR